MFSACKEAKVELLYIIQVYIITFAVFPGVMTTTSLTFIDHDGPWYSLMIVTLVNLFDTIGRYLGGKYFAQERILHTWAWLRLVQCLMFILVAFPLKWHFSGVSGDVFKLLNLALFATGNGYL